MVLEMNSRLNRKVFYSSPDLIELLGGSKRHESGLNKMSSFLLSWVSFLGFGFGLD